SRERSIPSADPSFKGQLLSAPELPSQRRSPDIFARSSYQSKQKADNHSKAPIPPLRFDVDRTPRATFTLQESPKRKRNNTSYAPSELHPSSNTELRESDSSRSTTSDRILEPPQPIFTSGALGMDKAYESDAFDELTLQSHSDRDYAYQIYQKEYDDKESYSDAHTAFSGSSYVSSNPESDYFKASLDQDMMQNITNGYIPNREKTLLKRKVRIVDGNSGNLVLENRIPDELRKVLTRTESPFGEFTNMTYTACTAEPDDFVREGFTLRAAKYGRETEIVVCVTMYNEDEVSFARTMHGI
ncbi:hypothetical protein OXX69_012347, partial [Metschnikowia pulcherrima]